MLLYEHQSFAPNTGVSEEPKKTKLEPWQTEDAARLKALFDAYRASGGLKQEQFAADYGLKSQGNMGHYLHGRRPLNLRAAISFARGMGVSIDAISPTIAAEVEEAIPLMNTAPTGLMSMPLRSVTPRQIASLSPEAIGLVESFIFGLLGLSPVDTKSNKGKDGPLNPRAAVRGVLTTQRKLNGPDNQDAEGKAARGGSR